MILALEAARGQTRSHETSRFETRKTKHETLAMGQKCIIEEVHADNILVQPSWNPETSGNIRSYWQIEELALPIENAPLLHASILLRRNDAVIMTVLKQHPQACAVSCSGFLPLQLALHLETSETVVLAILAANQFVAKSISRCSTRSLSVWNSSAGLQLDMPSYNPGSVPCASWPKAEAYAKFAAFRRRSSGGRSRPPHD